MSATDREPSNLLYIAYIAVAVTTIGVNLLFLLATRVAS